MNEILNFILIIATTLIMIPVANIMHELGHAIPALLFSRKDVKIVIGKNNERIMKFKVNRLIFIFRGFNFIFSATDYNITLMKPGQQIAAFAGGPVISFIFGESLWAVSRIISNTSVYSTMSFIQCYFIMQFIVSAIPVIYPHWFGNYAGYPSDGYKVVTVLKNSRRNK